MGLATRFGVTNVAASTPTSTALVADGVQVWMARVHESVELHARLNDLLSADECARASRFRFPVDQRRFVTARGALRLVLGAYGQVDPRELSFDYLCVCGHPQCSMSRRKPMLRAGLISPRLHFNVSHSDDVVLIAVSATHEVGVDVERIRPEIEWRALAAEALSPSDAASVLAHSGREGLLAFYRCWTHKEAFLKAIGRGLTTPRALQPQDLASTAIERIVDYGWAYEDRHFTARTLDGTPSDCIAALVVEAPASGTPIPIRPLALEALLSVHDPSRVRSSH